MNLHPYKNTYVNIFQKHDSQMPINGKQPKSPTMGEWINKNYGTIKNKLSIRLTIAIMLIKAIIKGYILNVFCV
jgi:hypothetical protein